MCGWQGGGRGKTRGKRRGMVPPLNGRTVSSLTDFKPIFFGSHRHQWGINFVHINARLRSQPCRILHLPLRRKGPQLPNLYQPGRRKNRPSYEGQKEKLAQFLLLFLLLFSPCPRELRFSHKGSNGWWILVSLILLFCPSKEGACSHRHQRLSAVQQTGGVSENKCLYVIASIYSQ